MIAAGIDLGGTKIEVQVFDADWQVVARNRVPTPKEYGALVKALADQIAWVHEQAKKDVPIGIGAAGLVNPATGLALTANLCATGKPLPRDVAKAAGRPITYVNDCRSLALSEAVFGAGKGHRSVMSLILGTGVGGGIAVDGHLLPGPSMTGGEFGHISAPAHLVQRYGLEVVKCGCGRMGCRETLIAGPGLSRIAKSIIGRPMSPPDIVAARETDELAQKVWQIWCELTADLLRALTLIVDPDIIVVGGGLTQIQGMADDLNRALDKARLGDFEVPPVVVAQGGDTSGARGAAYAAFQETSSV